jgi:P27 family predicted phage terminase small subunit
MEDRMRGRKPVISPLGEEDVVDLPSSMARVPKPPDCLKGRARELWPSVVGELVVRNIYADDCCNAAMAYCVQFARFLEAEERISEAEWVSVIGKDNHEICNPLFKISNDACDRMHKIAGDLGLTPVARKRVQKIRGGTSTAPASKYLKQG